MQKLFSSFSPNLARILRFSTAISPPSDFLPSYLVNKCGFSPDKGAKAAERIPRRVRSPDQPDSVISFFKSNGFDDSHLKKIFHAYPEALALSVEKALVPKFHTLQELGFKGDDLISLVCSDRNILRSSMGNQVVPMINLWRNLLGSHSLLMKCLARSPWYIVTSNLRKTTQNISILRECELSDHQISVLVSSRPSIIILKSESLNELVSRVERLGLPRGSLNFHWALFALSKVSEDNLQAKVGFFKGFGWSEDDFSKAFRKSPIFITSSLNALKEKMEFYVKEAGCSASYIALNPVVLMYSLEKRLIPRVKVLKALKEKGLNGGNHKLCRPITLTNKKFFQRYIAPYKETNPELSKLFCLSS